MADHSGELFPETKKLFLLDGMALFYRAHFALVRSPRMTSAGLCTSGVFGMANTVMDILSRESPTHIAVAFDTSEPTQRHIDYELYKAQRDAMPEDMAQQIPWIDRLFDAMNIPSIRMPGFEADDIIGTLAHRAGSEDYRTFMVTPDKDYHQLVTEDALIYKPGRKGSESEIIGVPEVLAKWEIQRVDQVIDILGLMGDASDNIPGIPGIGPKTAQKLIAQYGSIENLLEHASELKGKQRERVEENADMARLSKKLVTILLDVPVEADLASFACRAYDTEKMKTLFMELEFDSLGKKLFGKSFSSAANRAQVIREKRETEIQASLFDEPVEEKTIHDVAHQYHTITTPDQRRELIEQLKQQPQICFDTETTGLDPREATPLGMSFSFQPHEAYYVVCPDDLESAQAVLNEFRPIFEDDSITKIGHNLKYDLTLLKWNGIDVRGDLFDTMLAHSMKEPEMRHGLDYLAKLYLGYKPIPTKDLIGEKGPDQKNMRDVPLDALSQYACEDADVTWRVALALRPDIEARGVSKVCYEVECPLIPVLVDMEREGIRLDTEALAIFSKKLDTEIESLHGQIIAAAGHDFNIDSPKQLGIVLYEELEVEANPKKTATGQYSTRESELERLSARHPIIADVLEYRNARKLRSTYVDQLPAAVNPKTGHLHTHYSQSWTATGRMQSNDPNLQTIPVRKERGRDIRAAFVPRDDDHLILSADYSQIELRVMAQLSGDAGMLEAFQSGEDIHTVTASKVYKTDIADVTREMRDKAKTVNFGIIYGISAFGLQQRLNIPRSEAGELIQNYFEKYPGVQEYIDRTIAFAKEHGYVATQTGRRRYLRDINSKSRTVVAAAERLAMNSPIQGTAADMLKLAMIRVHKALREGGFQTKMVLTVHDEIVFDMLRSEQDTVMPVIEEAMKTTLPMTVPIVVEMGVGRNWLEAH
ncbi:DNA polymerase I [Rubripirellula lacrimiformis]|uniref:DNA polymerase I n=1 Tax=Rubripirellula lacrimiformis TaxID=1930273 RepID=A0A517N8W3_9BACT|nr:DNA polymerase I [Rubripirellula lacrimiformis]QDT03574.1 DNA polymerase I [Rubripirellula lacrimiformis]